METLVICQFNETTLTMLKRTFSIAAKLKLSKKVLNRFQSFATFLIFALIEIM